MGRITLHEFGVFIPDGFERGRYLKQKAWKRLDKDNGAVASTVGTIMALMVILAFLSLITTQYVPVWMKDSEANHMSEAFNQFSMMKSTIDTQIALDYSQVMFNPIKLGAKGVPVFATATYGSLTLSPSQNDSNLEISLTNVDAYGSRLVEKESSGVISLDVKNRYFVAQKIAYEHGAIILTQGGDDDQVVKANPPIVVDNGELWTTMISLDAGTPGSVTGDRTEGIYTQLERRDPSSDSGNSSDNYAGITSNISFSLDTDYGLAWFNFFNETFIAGLDVDVVGDLVDGWVDPVNETRFIDYNQFSLVYEPSSTFTGKDKVELIINNGEIRNMYMTHAVFDVKLGTEGY